MRASVKSNARLLVAVAAMVVAGFTWAAPLSENAAAAGIWSKPTLLFSTTGFTSNPVLVSDSSGDVHLFFWYSEQRGDASRATGVLMYARLHRGVWSKPVDVQAPADGGAQQSVALDSRGFLHLIWL